MKRSALCLITAGLLGFVPAADALTFLDLATGDEALMPDARAASLGRTRVAEGTGAFTGMSNPAGLAWAGDPRVSLGGGVQKLKETRSIPAFDSFDGFLVESIYALNDEYQYRGGIAASGTAPAEWGIGNLGLGVSFAPVRDFQYDYAEEVRDNNTFTQPRDQLLALNSVQSDGTLDALTVGIGFAPPSDAVVFDFSVGASVQFLSGHQDLLHRTFFVAADTTSATVRNVNGISGVRGVFGVVAKPHHRIDAAATFKTETTVDGDFLQSGNPSAVAYLGTPALTGMATGTAEITYPAEFAVGVAYRPQAHVRTTVRVDATWTEWSQFAHDLWADLALENVWDVRFGIEHTFYNGYPVRFGFLYRPSPQNNEVATTSFTFGGGLDVGPLRADLGFEIGNRDYRFQDLFDDSMFGGTTRTSTDLVDESTLTAYGSVSYALEGFGG
ncbi:MAG: hypothetical protein HKN12_09440 [Gemmatimonadetes bacterium]|nr:hypothetical protein [Gemmatimonadota bacterium]